MMNLDGFGFQDGQPTIPQSEPSVKQNRIIIKGNSEDEVRRKG
jgi:hypothetical protein